jgi:cytidylate kinase
MRERPIVAIDGPAGAGKSTVARRLADALGYLMVDTGALYRAVALAASRRGVSLADADAVGEVADGIVARAGLRLERAEDGSVRVWLDGEDVSQAIRTPEVSMGASTVSAHGPVRAALLELQRAAGRAGGVVLEGRDIGTVVFPDAEVKFFLTARPEIRARRRCDELRAKGQDVSLEDTLAEVQRRDAQDSGRAVAPLRKAEDALEVDSSESSVDEVVAAMAARVAEVAGRLRAPL